MPKNEREMQILVDGLQELRRNVDAAELALLRGARKIELHKKAIWGQFFASFDAMLEQHNILDAKRYREFVEAEKDLSANTFDSTGVDAGLQAMKIQDTARREKYLQAAGKRFAEAGVPWSSQEARAMRLSIGGAPPKDSNWNKKIDREEALRQEVIELKRERQELRRQLKEKEAEVARLSAALRGTLPKPKRTGRRGGEQPSA